MAVVSRPPAWQQLQPRKAYQHQQARGRPTSGVLYGSSGNVDGAGGSADILQQEWSSRAQGSGRSGKGDMSKSGRSVEQSNVVYQGDDFDGGFGSWCGCMNRSGAVTPPPRGGGVRGGKGRKGGKKGSGEVKSGDVGSMVKNFSGSFERSVSTSGSSPVFRPRLSPGKVSPVVEVVPPPASISAVPAAQHQQTVTSAVFSMSNYNLTSAAKMQNSSSGVSSSPPVDKIKASPTLFEMMTHEQELGPKAVHTISLSQQLTFQEKMKSILSGTSPGNQFNATNTSDLKLILNNREGYSVTVNVHRHILVTHSRFFAAKLSDRWSKQQRTNSNLIEITDIDDVEIYLETLRLMYCEDVKKSLMKENVSRVLGILKLSAHIMFEGGVFACLEYLEAVPWADEEEEKVTALMGQLQLESVGVAADVMKRCSALESTNSEDVLVRLLQAVTKGTDDKARREMKSLVSRMLRENMSQNKNTVDVSKESLYRACHACLDSLLHLFMQSKSGDDRGMLIEISRQADNLHWLVDILIDRRIADDFVRMWAHQAELANLHAKVPVMFRYEVSRLTARLCIAIGKGQVKATC
ncbi:BTB/POZ domain-containing protein At1g63850 isoform X2 [Physcomitrium patens]|uniref:BTB/POZ domain-containing protein At1g63850 isoform X2 n=1 Tax=Physcomitrium patens TaxID=3218 RepID=UPI000D16F7CF|nr:BTB/POZ domain-containing protein At1g63850-like isoform X2 [Physcomitrium patens]|eukprot:XP_024369459.1 BTB/POZ domain-containing protein At1g63850-like isoform X2 [Physcomitrella patens]